MVLRRHDIVMAAVNAVVWGIPTAIYTWLFYDRCMRGDCSIALFEISPAPFLTGLLLSIALPISLIRMDRPKYADSVGSVLLALGLLLGIWGVLMLGSL